MTGDRYNDGQDMRWDLVASGAYDDELRGTFPITRERCKTAIYDDRAVVFVALGYGRGVKRETNWTAVGALAAVAGTLIALLAYLHGSATPNPVPAPPAESSSFAAPPPKQDSKPPVASKPGSPAACQQADAAIRTYRQTVGTTWLSRRDAATRATNQLSAAYRNSLGSGSVSSDLSVLVNDIVELRNNALLIRDSSRWDTTSAQVDADTRVLDADCGTG